MNPIHAHGLLLLAAFFWGSGNVAQKTVLEHIGPFTAAGVTCLIGACIISPLAFRKARKWQGHGMVLQLASIVIVFACAIVAMQIGYGGTTVTNAGFLVNTSAAMTPMAAWIILREKPILLVWPAVALTLSGAWLMGGGVISQVTWGDGVVLLAAALFAVWTPLVCGFLNAHGNPGLLTLLQFLFCGTACLAIGLFSEPLSLHNLYLALPELIIIGVLSKGLAYFLMAAAQQHSSASVTAIIVSTEAVFGALFASYLLGERMTSMGVTGAMLIIAGIVVIQCPDLLNLQASWRKLSQNKHKKLRNSIALSARSPRRVQDD
jgi:drug/metabolite transporter (DMT)-like permease